MKSNTEQFRNNCIKLFSECSGNIVDIPGIGETELYEEPLIGFASADDEIFEEFRRKEAIGSNYCSPSEWLPEARTVAAFFLPFSEKVRVSNRKEPDHPSTEWLYARIEGQEFIGRYMRSIMGLMEEKGIRSCVPSLDERFGISFEMTESGGTPDFHADSRWSERHAAYACGLGTFGLSRGLITAKGMAGRFASIVISEELEPSVREYTGIYDYCIRCGACVRKCPVNAISLENGKNNVRCNEHVENMKKEYSPRYGCGKCQVGVPCENKIPRRHT